MAWRCGACRRRRCVMVESLLQNAVGERVAGACRACTRRRALLESLLQNAVGGRVAERCGACRRRRCVLVDSIAVTKRSAWGFCTSTRPHQSNTRRCLDSFLCHTGRMRHMICWHQ